jgi:IS30 family transposase
MPTNIKTVFDSTTGQFVTKETKRKFLTEEERKEIWRLRRRNLPMQVIAKRIKCSTCTVRRWIEYFAKLEGKPVLDLRNLNDRVRAYLHNLKKSKSTRWPVIQFFRKKFEATGDVRWLPTDINQFDRFNSFSVRLLTGPPF